MEEVKEYFGSVSALAEALGVTQPAASFWLINGHFPPLRAVQIERLTGGKFKAVDLVEGGKSADISSHH